MGSPATEKDTEALYREHGAAVARFCQSLLRDPAEAEDATQQVFLSAHRALLNGSAPREPLAWLLAVARHECHARFRGRSTSPTLAGDAPDTTTPDASVHALRAGELATVWDEVARMPQTQRDAFLLREIRGLSYRQLAAELSLSAASVRSLLVRARARLRHRLRDVAAGLGGAPWIQALVRLVGGGDGASPVPAATKAAVVGVGALALVGGGDLARVNHRPSSAPRHTAATRHRTQARVRRVATPVAAPVTPSADRPSGRVVRAPVLEHSRGRDDGSGGSGSHENSGRDSSSSDGSSGSGHDGSIDTTAVAQPSSDGRDGGGSGSTGTSSGSGRDSSGHGSPDGGSSGSTSSGSGPDGGSGTTTTSSSSDGGGGPDGGSSGPGG